MLARINVGQAVQQELRKRKAKLRHYRPTTAAVITNSKGHLLLVQEQGNGAWGFVKGGIEWGERKTLSQALLREVYEEVGIRVEVQQTRYLGSVKNRGFTRDQTQHEYALGKHFHCYHVCLNNKQVRRIKICAKDLSDYKWIKSKPMLMRLPMLESRRDIIASVAMQLQLPWAQT